MMGRKLLIDTNVFIGLEDQREVAPEFAKLLELCQQHGVRYFVHEAAIQDIKRDRDTDRQKISLSKVRKFELLKGIQTPAKILLEERFGQISKVNDDVDVALLHALDIGAIDFLVSQDQGIHARARRNSAPLANRVHTVADAVAWLRATFEPTPVNLPLIEEVLAHAIPLDDDIFDSLRAGYPNFDNWWRDKCVNQHRLCWKATINGELAGLIVRKDETHSEAKTHHKGPKILKVCTFKVKPAFRGEKLGELLLKQILWFAQKNGYDLIYLTIFADQKVLIEVLEYFGFKKTKKNKLGELVYEKPLSRQRLKAGLTDNVFELARINYPRFVGREPAAAFCVPIQSEFHNRLFPELAQTFQGELFGTSHAYRSDQAARIPGNTIRKVYLCRAQTNQLQPGAVLLFYRSSSPGYVSSQSVTSVGVVESISQARNLDDLIRLTAKRSVYTEKQLAVFNATCVRPVKVIDFLLVGHLEPPMNLTELVGLGVFNGRPPQSICRLPPERFQPVRSRMNFGFGV